MKKEKKVDKLEEKDNKKKNNKKEKEKEYIDDKEKDIYDETEEISNEKIDEDVDENDNKKSKKIILIILILFILLIGGFCIYNILLIPRIKLKGKSVVVLNYKDKYVEKGYSASYLNKDITKSVKVKGKVNSEKLGTYEISYKVKKGFFLKKVIRKVIVKDTVKPSLEVNSDDIYICPGSDFVPDKIKATDDYDGDISHKVESILNKEKTEVTYSVKDSSGNLKSVTKKIIYEDKENPIITLNGNEVMYVTLGGNFSDPGVSINDNCDGNISGSVVVSGGVNTNSMGEYNITYSVKDSAGNESSVKRKVVVTSGVIYLTFDDGPNSGTTNVILDILKEEGVKATFFVTNKGPDELIKREYDEGHTVALHTATHDYSIIYSSDEAYFNDLYSVQQRVKNITGYESKIMRFPGGASNTVSRRYSVGIMSRLTKEVVARGFKYYDWNVSSGDAGNTTDPNVVYSNVVNSLNRNRPNMVLMHDIKPYTRDALRNIIRYGKNNGYTFEKITMDTEMITQRVNN